MFLQKSRRGDGVLTLPPRTWPGTASSRKDRRTIPQSYRPKKALTHGKDIYSADTANYACDDPNSLQGLGASDCKTELSRRNILADSGTDQTAQRTLVAE
jgi:hypothetical protein